ncbi:hypothetical protein [Priestia megaterium]|uniref:hypothetical protein n=1 Tax=Priestia megaterium TaxID=1404 RepID=UPI00112A0AD9|nr:hypothetical protein [Priestia megaterium]TPF14219.1 hypothetical protein CBE78_26275 [Priestia megaterium]TPF19412.1 hypothetical protein CBE79_27285 [Priestia megaterium]
MINNILNYMYDLPIVGELIQGGFSINFIIGSIVFALVALTIINGALKRSFDVNLLKELLVTIRNKNTQKIKRYNKKRDKFYRISTTSNFVSWQNEILKKIYSDYNLLSLFNKEYPIIIFEPKLNCIYPFKEFFSRHSELKSVNIPYFKLDRKQKFYTRMMGSTIKWPDLIGFEIDKFSLDEDSKIESFTANVCQYKHNVVTSHILEYELYKCYINKRTAFSEKTSEEILHNLFYRKKIHRGKSQTEVVTTGCNRHSLLSVQMLVAYYDDELDNYRVLLFQRSKDVAIKPNYWQLIPAGGFEIFEKEETTNSYIIKQNFNIELVLFRELIEEALDGEDFQYNKHGNIKEIINNHKDVVQIKEWLKSGQATLEFVGNVVDLVSLRSELSFVLVIDNPEFGKKNFKINHEGKDLQTIFIDELPHMLTEELLYPSSAGLLQLAMKSQSFKNRGLLQKSY